MNDDQPVVPGAPVGEVPGSVPPASGPAPVGDTSGGGSTDQPVQEGPVADTSGGAFPPAPGPAPVVDPMGAPPVGAPVPTETEVPPAPVGGDNSGQAPA